MNLNRSTFIRACAAAAALAFTLPSMASDYPNKPIKIVVPFAPGGISDLMARLMGEEMAKTLGQPFVVESKPGGGGNIGAALVARERPDGYTLLMGATSNFSINQFIFKDMPYDPFGFTPIMIAVDIPQVIVVNAKVPVKTLKELVDHAKTHKVNLGSQGVGTTTQIALAMLNQAAGTQIEHIPYKGAGAVTPAIMSGEVEMAIAGLSNVQAIIKSGTVRPLAVTSKSRMAALPDVPTTAEAGYPAVQINNWFGLVAPKGLPRDVAAKLHDAAVKALKSPAVEKAVVDAGLVIVASSPADMERDMRSKADVYRRAIEAAGIEKQ